MKCEILKNEEISPREKTKLERAESLVPAVIELLEKTDISMTKAIIEILKRKGITAQEDIEYYTHTIPSLAGKKGAWSREKKRAAAAEEEARYQELEEKSAQKGSAEQKARSDKEKQLDLFA